MSEKFALKWNDFQSNWNSSLSELRKQTDLADVTLMSDDMMKFSAHKILLSSCSSMFKFILKGNTHANPLLYLGGVTSVNLGFILDYIYYGEVNLYEEQLDGFLESAQKLEMEGLMGLGDTQDSKENSVGGHIYQEEQIKEEKYKYQLSQQERSIVGMEHLNKRSKYCRPSSNNSAKINVGFMNSEEIEKKMKELYQKIDGVWRCLECDYSTTRNYSIKIHIDTHIEGLSYSCNLCNKEFR